MIVIFDRHYYTASRKRGEAATLAFSEGIDEVFIEAVLIRGGYINYRKPKKMGEPYEVNDIEIYPVSFRFFMKENKIVFSVIHYSGRANHTPNRFGNFFADTIIDNQKNENLTPYNVFNSNIEWKSNLTLLEDLDFPDIIGENKRLITINPSYQEKMVEHLYISISNKFNRFKLKLWSVLIAIIEKDLISPAKKIIIYGSIEEVKEMILLSSGAFPNEFLEHLSFTTYTDDPTLSPYSINGVIPESEINLEKFKRKPERYTVIELDKIVDVEPSKNEYVEFLIGLIEAGEVESIINLLNENYQSFGVTKLDTRLNRVAKFHKILNQIVTTGTEITLQGLLSEFHKLNQKLQLEGINIFKRIDEIYSKAAECRPSELDDHFKSELDRDYNNGKINPKLIRDSYDRYLKYFKNDQEYDYHNNFLLYATNKLEESTNMNLLPEAFWNIILVFIDLYDRIGESIFENVWCSYAVQLLSPENHFSNKEKVYQVIKATTSEEWQRSNPYFSFYELEANVKKDEFDTKNCVEKLSDFIEQFWGKVKAVTWKWMAILLKKLFKKKEIESREILVEIASLIGKRSDSISVGLNIIHDLSSDSSIQLSTGHFLMALSDKSIYEDREYSLFIDKLLESSRQGYLAQLYLSLSRCHPFLSSPGNRLYNALKTRMKVNN